MGFCITSVDLMAHALVERWDSVGWVGILCVAGGGGAYLLGRLLGLGLVVFESTGLMGYGARGRRLAAVVRSDMGGVAGEIVEVDAWVR